MKISKSFKLYIHIILLFLISTNLKALEDFSKNVVIHENPQEIKELIIKDSNLQDVDLKKNKGNMHCSESVRSNPKRPESVEDGQCDICGSPATVYNYGIDSLGNEDWRTDCSNPRCDNYGLTKKSTHPAAPRGNMRGYM